MKKVVSGGPTRANGFPEGCRPAGYNPVELSRDWHGLCFMGIE